MSGCDTTSALFSKGKVNLVKITQNKKLFKLLKEFYNPQASKDKLEAVTSQFFIAAYVKKSTNSDLDSVRYMLYQQYVAKRSLSTDFNLASLPPTSNSAKYHGFRVFHQVSQIYRATKTLYHILFNFQVQAWLNNHLPPQDWGWSQFIPTKALPLHGF